jgi:L-asparaginase
MMADPRTGQMRPMDLEHLEDHVPELERMGIALASVSFERPIDSSDMASRRLGAYRATDP